MVGNLAGGLLLQAFGWAAVLRRPGLALPLVLLCLASGWAALEVPTAAARSSAPRGEGAGRPRRHSCASCAVDSCRRLTGGSELRGAPQVYIAALAAFFVKFVRYALLFWLPYYNWAALGYEASKAAYHASVFELGGFFGSMGLGPLSDRLSGPSAHRRAAPSAALLVAGAVLLGVGCPLAQDSAALAQAGLRDAVLGLGVFLVGISIDGPESVITGALCNDLCEDCGLAAAVGRVVGLVNGTGILGALLAGPAATAWARSCGGWRAVFPLLAAASLLGAAALLPLCNFASRRLAGLRALLAPLAAAALLAPALLLRTGACTAFAGPVLGLG